MPRKVGIPLAIVLLAAIVLLLMKQVQQTTGASPTREALTSPPDFTGWVLQVDPGSDQVKVESQTDKIVRQVIVILTKDTMIFRKEKGILRQVEFSEVHLQDQAELWLIGPVPSSFPAEVNVRQIVVENPY